jgi:hypothetical protein
VTAALIGLLGGLASALVGALLTYLLAIRNQRREGEAAETLLGNELGRAVALVEAALESSPKDTSARAKLWAPEQDWALNVRAWDSYGDRLARSIDGRLAGRIGTLVDELRALRSFAEQVRQVIGTKRESGPRVADLQKTRTNLKTALDELRSRGKRWRLVRRGLTAGFVVLFAVIGLAVGIFVDTNNLSENEVAKAVESIVDPGAEVSTCQAVGTGRWKCTVVGQQCEVAATPPAGTGPCTKETTARANGDEDTACIEIGAAFYRILQANQPTAKPTLLKRVLGKIKCLKLKDQLAD